MPDWPRGAPRLTRPSGQCGVGLDGGGAGRAGACPPRPAGAAGCWAMETAPDSAARTTEIAARASGKTIARFRNPTSAYVASAFRRTNPAKAGSHRLRSHDYDARYCRNAYTNNALPAAIATYCFPFTEYDIGPAETWPPTFPFQSCSPVRASSAKKYPSRPPANTRSDAVDSTPLSVTSSILNSHLRCPDCGSKAWIAP